MVSAGSRTGFRLRNFGILLVGTAILLRASSVFGDGPPFVAVSPGAPIWGGSILFTDSLAADIAATGCQFVRINFRLDGNPSWTEPHLTKYDTIITNARNHNLQVLGLICYEAVDGGQADWNENYDTTGMNGYIVDFAATAYMLINRYKSDIKHFELWNEPDCWSVPPESNPLEPGCFYIWPANYANLLAETYKKCIQEGGSDFFSANGIALVTGGLFAHDIGGSFSTSRPYMTNVYDQASVWDAFELDPNNPTGRRYPWDYFGYHFYLNQGEPVSTTELAAYFNDIRAMKSIYNDATDFLVTEFGWNTQSVSEQRQADNLAASYDWMRTQGDIRSAHWYCWADGGGAEWGLVAGGVPKLSYYEFVNQCGQSIAPSPDFYAYPLSGDAPLDVQFTNTSSGVIDTYHWEFGDLETSADENPLHTYQEAGIYTVALTVTGPGGQNTETKIDYIGVTAPVDPADFDVDGDVDLADFAVFAQCFTGSGGTTVPAGCETAATVPATHTYETAGSLSGLSVSISAGDLINSVVGTVEAGGFYGGLSPPADVYDLTDGVAGAPTEAVLADYSRPSLQIRYDLAAPQTIESINVLAAGADGRVFQNYDVQHSVIGDGSFQTLIDNVTTGPFGQVNDGSIGATLTQITGSQPGPIGVDVDSLRFVFYDVSTVNPASVFWDEWDADEPGDIDGNPRAYVGSVIKEIDVFEYTGPSVGNIADFDHDGDADLDDFAALESSLITSGP